MWQNIIMAEQSFASVEIGALSILSIDAMNQSACSDWKDSCDQILRM